MIWNKEELKNIKKIILLRANLKVNDNGEIEFTPKAENIYKNHMNYSSFEEYGIELVDLLQIQTKEEIINVLEKVKNIKADPTNPEHFGFVMNVSRINPNNHEEIFTIFKEIIGQYEKATSKVAHLVVDNITDIKELIEYSKKFSHTTETTKEELLVKAEINKIFSLANNITESEIFKSLIQKLDNSIKNKLTQKLNLLVNQSSRKYYKSCQLISDSYQAENSFKNKKYKH